MQTIITKHLGPTATKRPRVRATTSGGAGSVTLTTCGEWQDDQNHKAAAETLRTKLGWGVGRLFGGHTKDGMVWVFETDTLRIESLR